MVEVEHNYASKGVAGTALGLGAGALGVELLRGGLGGIFNANGMNCGCNEDHYVNRYELSMTQELTNKDMEIAYLRGRDAAKSDSLELYKYVDGKFAAVERELCDQKVFNATQISTISCIQNQVAQLMGLTKVVIPDTSVCPQPMAMYNSWTAPTTTTTTGA